MTVTPSARSLPAASGWVVLRLPVETSLAPPSRSVSSSATVLASRWMPVPMVRPSNGRVCLNSAAMASSSRQSSLTQSMRVKIIWSTSLKQDWAAARLGMIIFVPVSIFEHKPQFCPFGHRLWPGGAQVSWKPCICAAALEGAERGRGMGHVWVTCRACHDQLRQTAFYEPPHDIRHHQAGV
jgi:hypothetical protein